MTVNVLWYSKSGKLKAERLLARVSVLEHCSGALPTLTAVRLKTTSPIPDSNGTLKNKLVVLTTEWLPQLQNIYEGVITNALQSCSKEKL